MFHPPGPDDIELKQRKLPPLCEDSRWLEVMGPMMSDELRVLLVRQEAVLQEERQSARHLIQLRMQKKEVLAQLLELSGQLQRHDPEAQSRAERSKALLERINEEMDHLQFRTEAAPREIQKLNGELLAETVALGYRHLLSEQERTADLGRRIQALRRELLALNEEKYAAEDAAAALGQLLHALLGKELSDRMDARYGLERRDAE